MVLWVVGAVINLVSLERPPCNSADLAAAKDTLWLAFYINLVHPNLNVV